MPLPIYTIPPGDIMINFATSEDRVIRNGGNVIDNVVDNVVEVMSFIKESPNITTKQIAGKLV